MTPHQTLCDRCGRKVLLGTRPVITNIHAHPRVEQWCYPCRREAAPKAPSIWQQLAAKS